MKKLLILTLLLGFFSVSWVYGKDESPIGEKAPEEVDCSEIVDSQKEVSLEASDEDTEKGEESKTRGQ